MEQENLIRNVKKQAAVWLASNIDTDTRRQIEHMLNHDETELVESFYRNLEFGTGGLRGVMGAGTNRMNIYTVGMATQGLANYLRSYFGERREISVAIAHDCRNNSRLYAETTAKVLAANRIRAFIFTELRPTPQLSFAIRAFGCQAGVVITASHNPKEYNGYKVYWEDGGQIIAPHDRNIITEVKGISGINDIRFEGDQSLVRTIPVGFDREYLERISTLSLSPEAIRKHRDLKIVYTPIHGSGVKLVPEALKKFGFSNVFHVPEQDQVNGEFPTVHSPNPEEPAALSMALDKAEQVGADLVMGTDPDADRVGIAVRDNNNRLILLNGNQTGSLLFYYLIRQWSEKGKLSGREYVVKTIVTTELLAEIAASYGVRIFNVLTGFKYIAGIMLREEGKMKFIAGAEESYGYLAGDFVRDKDAVMACALIAETAAWAGEKGKSLYDLLLDIYIEFGLYHESLVSIYKKGKSGTETIAKMMEDYRLSPPSRLAGSKVSMVHDYLSGESLEVSAGRKTAIDLPHSNVLQYITEDNTRVSIRPSGTEPKIKFYFSVKGNLESHETYPRSRAMLEKKIEHVKKDLKIVTSQDN